MKGRLEEGCGGEDLEESVVRILREICGAKQEAKSASEQDPAMTDSDEEDEEEEEAVAGVAADVQEFERRLGFLDGMQELCLRRR